MACRRAYRAMIEAEKETAAILSSAKEKTKKEINPAVKEKMHFSKLLFGVDSKTATNTVLQNNITVFEWAKRSKIYPGFWGRQINGENSLSKKEIEFLHSKACKIAAIYDDEEPKETKEQGKILAKKIMLRVIDLKIPPKKAIFLKIGEKDTVTEEFLKSYVETMLIEGMIPGIMTNTDAKYPFDIVFGKAVQKNKELFEKCVIWATAPTMDQYENITTISLSVPEKWAPFAPSGKTKKDIAIWQYGIDCDPIEDESENEVDFNVDLVADDRVLIEKMF